MNPLDSQARNRPGDDAIRVITCSRCDDEAEGFTLVDSPRCFRGYSFRPDLPHYVDAYICGDEAEGFCTLIALVAENDWPAPDFLIRTAQPDV